MSKSNYTTQIYAKNKDLLKEIKKSKEAFSSYRSEDDKNYDIILTDVKNINRLTIAEAKRNRASRLAKERHAEALLNVKPGEPKPKLSEFAINWKKIDKTDVVIRIMTYQHIPLEEGRISKPKTEGDHYTQLNFPPYQHYRVNENDEILCVGKSHWKGDLETGHYSKSHGQITDNLAMMYIKMCDRYGTRGNWRGYTYNDEMRQAGLMQLVAAGLQFNESKGQNSFAYLTQLIYHSFIRVLQNEKRQQTIKDDILEANDINPSYTRQNENISNFDY